MKNSTPSTPIEAQISSNKDQQATTKKIQRNSQPFFNDQNEYSENDNPLKKSKRQAKNNCVPI